MKENCPWWISIVDKYFLVTPLNIAIACLNGCSRSFKECVKHVQYLLYMGMCREPYILFVCSKVAFVNLRTLSFHYWRPDKPLLIQESFWFVKHLSSFFSNTTEQKWSWFSLIVFQIRNTQEKKEHCLAKQHVLIK